MLFDSKNGIRGICICNVNAARYHGLFILAAKIRQMVDAFFDRIIIQSISIIETVGFGNLD